MSKNLVIVESPAKSKTIKEYLGKNFKILASYGHVRDLEPKDSSVDTENCFRMKYKIIERSKLHIDAIKSATQHVDNIYLATDPDREGEAISWHVYELLKEAHLLKNKNVYRIAFNEITKMAVKHAVENPRKLSMSLVNAQQARRILDFLVGFKLSPLLWKKIRRGLSAGRVQSPALRMIVERELEIEDFKTQEYWGITAEIKLQKNFSAKLIQFNYSKTKQFTFTNQKETNDALTIIKKDAKSTLHITSVIKKQKNRNPQPPYTTSSLQQDAVRKLGFTTKKTMLLAQQLYEGIDVGSEGAVGLITYMRTDSTHFAQTAINDIRFFIQKTYGNKNLPKKNRLYKTKNQNAQEAHEAIRPTDVIRKPEEIKNFLTVDQFKLYKLIWQRTIACQMVHTVMDTITVELTTENKAHIFKITDSIITESGFLSVYQLISDDNGFDKNKFLPQVKKNDRVILNDIITKQHFTEAPLRYTEASLVKTLEEYAIGRPSTYATIISTLQQRDYVIIDKKCFKPTDVGRVVNNFLINYFKKYIEYSFTAKLEDQLDRIAEGKIEWIPVLEKFWTPFIQKILKIDNSVKKSDITNTVLDENCPECKNKLSIRLGKNGRFIGCTHYPECKYTRTLISDNNIEKKSNVSIKNIPDRKCPLCKSELCIKQGRYGKFIGCSGYPSCKHMEPLHKPKDTGVSCLKCKKNNVFEKKSHKGKVFYACAGFPECKNLFWYPPINEICPKCSSQTLLHKNTKKNGKQKVCPNNSCDFFVNIDPIKPDVNN